MSEATARILVWNLGWKSGSRRCAAAIRTLIAEHDPDVVCLAEAHSGVLSGGYEISPSGGYGYGRYRDDPGARRKVLLWSRAPWTEVDFAPERDLPPGRYLAAETATRAGTARCVGVCVPWFASGVADGGRRNWEDHSAFLERMPDAPLADPRAIVLGDFNQTLPRRRAPHPVYDALCRRLAATTVATAERADSDGRWPIDHIAIGRAFVARQVSLFASLSPEGLVLSDHACGAVVEIAAECWGA